MLVCSFNSGLGIVSKHIFQEIYSEPILLKVLSELGLSGATVSYLSFEVASKTLNYQLITDLVICLFAIGPGSNETMSETSAYLPTLSSFNP